ncbi:glycine receptor subunit alphaZ1-like protein [Dinothrombium tinctorium]|uniref:Glycine receptor subunit alphaZ1-like protein n=1 Tax=Dinothrombium tinctorium TaxID=1965070 RepID=A0A443RF53_9ACAR|nr:glycine receptor subunit alphaZ1-like protein [Dinothrombium tinctorium]RWS13898.1 glycine receptor subunit alphaZ1-like protein [Dinothrombium tinctorium]
MNLTDPANGYFKHIAPDSNGPIEVYIRINVTYFGNIEEIETEYSMQFLFQMQWNDSRLKFNHSSYQILGGNELLERIWYPSISLPNKKDPGIITNPNDGGHTLVRINRNGSVFVSKRYGLRASTFCERKLNCRFHLQLWCNMNFKSYPFDKQICDIIFESSFMPIDKLRLRWSLFSPFVQTQNIQFYGFELLNHTLRETTSVYPFTGNFSAVIVTITFARAMQTSLLDVYVPTTLFVMVSWLTFWIEIPAAPARVALGMTSMLTLVTKAKSERDQLPRVAYANALDVWIFVCTSDIVLSSKPSPEIVLTPPTPHSFLHDSKGRSASIATTVGSVFPVAKKEPVDIANTVDRYCRAVFPVGFFVFNIIYWFIILNPL